MSFDGWGAKNHVHILSVIIHWITQNWERRSVIVEFAELPVGKSGKAMADIIWESFGSDYKKVTESVKDDIITVTEEEGLGLNCAHKLFAVCGDNATNNDTFCDHLHAKLLEEHDNDPASTSGLPKCCFKGQDSRIRCIAHIISLVVNAVLDKLKSGSYKEAAELVAEANDSSDSIFEYETCSTLSVYMKVRAFVLWIQGSDERRAAWRKICHIMIPLDVDTRWNALYLMMLKARENKASIT
jgi:hypothetical protein